MNQQYVVVVRDPDLLDNPLFDLAADLRDAVPLARVVENRGSLWLIEVPIHEEYVLLAYFDDESFVITRKRTYTPLAASDSQGGA